MDFCPLGVAIQLTKVRNEEVQEGEGIMPRPLTSDDFLFFSLSQSNGEKQITKESTRGSGRGRESRDHNGV